MARIFDEKFETSPGYDETAAGNGSDWAETEGATSTVDPDEDTASAGNPSNWDSECLEIDCIEGENCYITNTFDSTQGDFWFRFEFYLYSHTIANNDRAMIAQIFDSVPSNVVIFYVRYADPNLYIQARCYHDGASHYYTSLSAISVQTVYRIEFKWNVTNDVWAWKIDGVNQPNDQDGTDPVESEGVLSLTHGDGLESLRLGGVSYQQGFKGYYDLVAVDNADWVGEETGGGGRTTKNTRSFPLGTNHAMPFRM